MGSQTHTIIRNVFGRRVIKSKNGHSIGRPTNRSVLSVYFSRRGMRSYAKVSNRLYGRRVETYRREGHKLHGTPGKFTDDIYCKFQALKILKRKPY